MIKNLFNGLWSSQPDFIKTIWWTYQEIIVHCWPKRINQSLIVKNSSTVIGLMRLRKSNSETE